MASSSMHETKVFEIQTSDIHSPPDRASWIYEHLDVAGSLI